MFKPGLDNNRCILIITLLIRDKDQDKWADGNNAQYRKGGGWFNNCCRSHLFGHHTMSSTTIGKHNQIWWEYGGERGNTYLSWKVAKMVIIPK